MAASRSHVLAVESLALGLWDAMINHYIGDDNWAPSNLTQGHFEIKMNQNTTCMNLQTAQLDINSMHDLSETMATSLLSQNYHLNLVDQTIFWKKQYSTLTNGIFLGRWNFPQTFQASKVIPNFSGPPASVFPLHLRVAMMSGNKVTTWPKKFGPKKLVLVFLLCKWWCLGFWDHVHVTSPFLLGGIVLI